MGHTVKVLLGRAQVDVKSGNDGNSKLLKENIREKERRKREKEKIKREKKEAGRNSFPRYQEIDL